MTQKTHATRIATGILALGLAAPAALADNHMSGPDYQAAQDFAQAFRDAMRTAFDEGNHQSLVAAMAERATDESTFHFSGEVVLSDGPTTEYNLAVSGDELTQLAQGAMGMGGMPSDLVEEYELEVVVNAAWNVPSDASGAEIAFYESGTFGEREGVALPTGPFSSSTVCTMHLGGGDQSQILTASCTTTSLL